MYFLFVKMCNFDAHLYKSLLWNSSSSCCYNNWSGVDRGSGGGAERLLQCTSMVNADKSGCEHNLTFFTALLSML